MAVNRQNIGMLQMNPNAPEFYPGIPYRNYWMDLNFESFVYKCAGTGQPLYSYVNARGVWLKGFYIPIRNLEDPAGEENGDGSRTVYLAAVALSNVFGVGGGALMARLIGARREEDARRCASYTLTACTVTAAVFVLLVFILQDPLLRLLGANDSTIGYAKQYLITTTVIGGIPTILSMCMPQLLRNAGYAKAAGFGVGLGSVANVLLDPLFMFVLLPEGKEVLGAGLATAFSNFISLGYFIVIFHRVKKESVLQIPRRWETLDRKEKVSFYSVGIPAAFAIFLFDLVTIVLNKLVVDYGDIQLAADVVNALIAYLFFRKVQQSLGVRKETYVEQK